MARTEQRKDEREPQSFWDSLEVRARELASRPTRPRDGFSVISLIEDEVALALDQLDRTRARWDEMKRDLLEAECYIDTELMQMEQRTPRYSPYRYPEREKLQKRRMSIAQERRRLMLTFGQKKDELRERLLSLLHKHRQLDSS